MTLLGAAIAFAAAVANAFALVLQADEARSTPPAESAHMSLLWRLARRRHWLLGTGLLALAWPLQVLALSFAPITVVQPTLATFQLILMSIARARGQVRLRPREWSAALATLLGIGLIVAIAPHRTIDHPPAGRVAVPVAVIGLLAVGVYLASRRRTPADAGGGTGTGRDAARVGRGGAEAVLLLAIGAGLGYAWIDFADKLLSNAISTDHWIPAALWLLAVMGFGVLAFLQENSALQQHTPVTVAPVIGALGEPLPVLMALAGGVEVWPGGGGRALGLGAGLALVGAGAVVLARTPEIADLVA